MFNANRTALTPYAAMAVAKRSGRRQQPTICPAVYLRSSVSGPKLPPTLTPLARNSDNFKRHITVKVGKFWQQFMSRLTAFCHRWASTEVHREKCDAARWTNHSVTWREEVKFTRWGSATPSLHWKKGFWVNEWTNYTPGPGFERHSHDSVIRKLIWKQFCAPWTIYHQVEPTLVPNSLKRKAGNAGWHSTEVNENIFLKM